MFDPQDCRPYIESLDCRPLFVTVSGSHLYGFSSPDSDVDLRGSHLLPLTEVLQLGTPTETLERAGMHQGIEVDLVSHDVRKFFGMLVKNNGYVLEQVFSPLIVVGHEALDELRPLAKACITRHHYHHYRGFYGTQRKLIEKEQPPRVKPVLYAYRVLLTGIHLLRSGGVEANLPRLNEHFRLPFIDDLIASKTTEQAAPATLDWPFHAAKLDALEKELDASFSNSRLPEKCDQRPLSEYLVRLRLGSN